VADNHAVFLAHGMNATGADRWLSNDCAHPNDAGHHAIRAEVGGVLTGDWP
jgi:hypothetical protein